MGVAAADEVRFPIEEWNERKPQWAAANISSAGCSSGHHPHRRLRISMLGRRRVKRNVCESEKPKAGPRTWVNSHESLEQLAPPADQRQICAGLKFHGNGSSCVAASSGYAARSATYTLSALLLREQKISLYMRYFVREIFQLSNVKGYPLNPVRRMMLTPPFDRQNIRKRSLRGTVGLVPFTGGLFGTQGCPSRIGGPNKRSFHGKHGYPAATV